MIIIDNGSCNLKIECLYDVGEYTTFQVFVESGEFKGNCAFCLSKKEINLICEKLMIMNANIQGICKVQDFDSDAYIVFVCENYGKLIITGQIGGSHEEQYLVFKMIADQAVIISLICAFKELIKN